MKKNLSFATATFFVISTMISCGNNDPALAPTIDVTLNHDIITMEVCEHMENNVIQVLPLDTLIITSHIEGDNDLSQMKIEIHDAGDCHSHERPITEWVYSKIVDLNSTSVTRTDTIIIPADVEHHNHHMSFKVLDSEGLSSEEVEYNLFVEE